MEKVTGPALCSTSSAVVWEAVRITCPTILLLSKRLTGSSTLLESFPNKLGSSIFINLILSFDVTVPYLELVRQVPVHSLF